MIALQYAALFPNGVDRLAVTACTGRTTPGTVALRRVQRRAITSDPNFHGGNYTDAAWPEGGMRVARELGMICYRSREEFDQRFDWHSTGAHKTGAHDAWQTPMVGALHEVEQYMEYMGEKFVASRYDPNCYLLQSRSMDLMDIGLAVKPAEDQDQYGGGTAYGDAIRQIAAERVFLCGIKQDALIPAGELQNLTAVLKGREGGGQHVNYHELSSLFGHDAFFKEFAWLGPRIRELLEGGIEGELAKEEQQKPMMAI
eukprot:SAG11_NODE_2269_length_3596_cov_2.380612_2_plen_257_part_00